MRTPANLNSLESKPISFSKSYSIFLISSLRLRSSLESKILKLILASLFFIEIYGSITSFFIDAGNFEYSTPISRPSNFLPSPKSSATLTIEAKDMTFPTESILFK